MSFIEIHDMYREQPSATHTDYNLFINSYITHAQFKLKCQEVGS